MSEKEAFDRTVKDDDFDLLVSFDRGMASLSCGIVSGPKMLSGGRLIVTRQ